MVKETNSTINIKTSTMVTILGLLVGGVLVWVFQQAWADYKRQNTIQWQKINSLENRMTKAETIIEQVH